MEACNHIAPAHNPPYVTGIRLFAQRMPSVPLIGLFETAFYQWMPPAMTRYAVPEAWHAMGIRRWGFHGASHKYIAERAAELIGHQEIAERVRQLYVGGASTATNPPDLRVISCHLGGSSSITAILNGVAVGTSMGFSPQSGLPQNNRVGDLDSFALPFLMRSTGMSLEEAEVALCMESGLQALSGGYNDFRDIEEQASQGNQKAGLALAVFVQQARHWIGSFLAQLNGADALVFTAGIGENRPALRSAVCANLDQLGIYLDEEANQNTVATEGLISPSEWPVKVMVIPTNEELVVAREVKRYLERMQPAKPARTAARKEQAGKPAASFSRLKSKLKR
jgi:acetate kinase